MVRYGGMVRVWRGDGEGWRMMVRVWRRDGEGME